ncbi:hypothetical protein ckin5_01590 [Helicobacter pylori]
MTYKELGKKVLEQAEEPLSVREIWERACEMGLDEELSSIGKTPIATLGISLVNTIFLTTRSNFMLQIIKKDPFVIGSNLVKENFHHKKPQMLKKKMMMDRASIQTQPKNKKPLLMKRKKRICTNCL